ncbi:MAG: glycoside hydrolase family 3 N-terminal domain-containing protein [Anaerolineales bacterium]
MNNSQRVGQKLLLAFKGKQPTPEIISSLQKYKPAGLSLFRSLNIDNPEQVRTLAASLQRLARNFGLPPLLIAIDQEGGQLMAIGEGTTPLPGNMALGATGSTQLALQAGEVLGQELAAMGINVNYAPSCDVNSNPHNPVIGTRSFGEIPDQVAGLAAAMINGIQSQGVAAVAKHFPGHGDTATDSHSGLPSLPHDLSRLQNVEFPPFQAAIEAGVKLVMSAHLALPAVDGGPDAPPATLSPAILKGILRQRLGFEGVIVSDALDMQAIQQGDLLGAQAVRAAAAGVDLLLVTSNPVDHERVHASLLVAVQNGQLDRKEISDSVERILALKGWLAGAPPAPGLEIVGCADHQAIATEIAERSITLVRDHAGLLPLKLKAEYRLAVIIPKPVDLTPADTSSYTTPGLAAALRKYHPNVVEAIIPYAPEEADIRKVVQQLSACDLLICGTLNAFESSGQAELVRRLLQTGIPTIVAALRLPYDLAAFPDAPTYLCTYSLLEPSMQALAKALFGHISINGKLPVSIPGLYKVGYSRSWPKE